MPILFFIGYGPEISFGLLILQAQQYANKNIKGNISSTDYNLTEINPKHQGYDRYDNGGIKICR